MNNKPYIYNDQSDHQSIKSLEVKVHLLNLNTSLKSDQKFNRLLESIDENIGKMLLKENIKTWDDVNEGVKKLNRVENRTARIVDICLRERVFNEDIFSFINEVRNEMTFLEIDETSMIKILSANIWPENSYIKRDLRRCISWADFISAVSDNMREMAKGKGTKSCNSCQKQGKKSEKFHNKKI
jgi:hypothetical protein